MAGYSGTPLTAKLGIKAQHRVCLLSGPCEFDATLGALPDGVTVTRSLTGKQPFDVIVLFCKDEKALAVGLAKAQPRMEQNAGLWIAWPKKASGIATDLTEGMVRERVLKSGLVD